MRLDLDASVAAHVRLVLRKVEKREGESAKRPRAALAASPHDPDELGLLKVEGYAPPVNKPGVDVARHFSKMPLPIRPQHFTPLGNPNEVAHDVGELEDRRPSAVRERGLSEIAQVWLVSNSWDGAFFESNSIPVRHAAAY